MPVIPPEQRLTLTEVTENFSRAAEIADRTGKVYILKDNRPQYLLLNLDEEPYLDLTDDEKIDIVAARIFKKYRKAFEELAK